MSENKEMIFQVRGLKTWFPITKGMFKKVVGCTPNEYRSAI